MNLGRLDSSIFVGDFSDIKTDQELEQYDRAMLNSGLSYYVRAMHPIEVYQIFPEGTEKSKLWDYVLVARASLDGLDYLHYPVPHRDITPRDILFNAESETFSLAYLIEKSILSKIDVEHLAEEHLETMHIRTYKRESEIMKRTRDKEYIVILQDGTRLSLTEPRDSRVHFIDIPAASSYIVEREDGTAVDLDSDALKAFFRATKCKGFNSLLSKIQEGNYLEIAIEILKVANTHKRYTIPEHATVVLEGEVVKYATITSWNKGECCQIAFCSTTRPDDLHTYNITVNVSDHFFVSDLCFPAHVRDWFFMIASCIIRDFIVCDMVMYDKREERIRKGSLVRKRRDTVYTYLPRKRVVWKESLPKRIPKSFVKKIKVGACSVVGHTRPLAEGTYITQYALKNAKEFGIVPKEGETFVCPHKRGESEQTRLYKSKSALSLLYESSAKQLTTS